MTIVHFISKDQGNVEQAVLLFAEEHVIEVELYTAIKDFLSDYKKGPKETRTDPLLVIKPKRCWITQERISKVQELIPRIVKAVDMTKKMVYTKKKSRFPHC